MRNYSVEKYEREIATKLPWLKGIVTTFSEK